MSDAIQHECGLAFIRLRKPLSYYQQTYGSVMWGLNKLYLLMEKQHNRGQDGAGVAAVKLNVEPGYPFLSRMRSNQPQPIADIFRQIGEEFNDLQKFNTIRIDNLHCFTLKIIPYINIFNSDRMSKSYFTLYQKLMCTIC